MTAEDFELTYSLSAGDRIRAHACLDRLSERRADPGLFVRLQPVLTPVVNVFIAYIALHWLFLILPAQLSIGWIEPFRPAMLIGTVVGAYANWYTARNVSNVISRYWGRENALWAGRDGVNTGDHRLNANPSVITVRRAAHSTEYSWPAFSGLHRTRLLLLLMLTPKAAVIIPRRAFASQAEELKFCDFVGRQISEG